MIIPNHGSWNVSQKPFEATTHAAVPWFPQGGDAEQRTRKPFTKRANRVDKYHEKGLQKWEELQKLLKADPLHRDLPALSPDQLRQGGWDIEHACGQTPSQSDLAVLLRSDPGTPPDDFCFDVSARQKDYQGWETTDGIVFRNNYCPGYGGLEVIKAYKETTDDDGRKYVARTSWSNVTWALWNFNCEDENQVAGLSWLAHKNIANKDTLEILDEMREDNEPETTERPGSGTYLAYTLKPDVDSPKTGNSCESVLLRPSRVPQWQRGLLSSERSHQYTSQNHCRDTSLSTS